MHEMAIKSSKDIKMASCDFKCSPPHRRVKQKVGLASVYA